MYDKLLERIRAVESVEKLLETYKRVETDESYSTGSDGVNTPVATLADEYGGRAQIGIDDHCYVLYLLQEDGSYKHTAWVFPEAHEVLKDLPGPLEVEKRLGEKKESLSPKQEEVLKKFELGKEYSAYNLKTSLGTLNALARKGYLTKKSGLGSMAFPSTSIMFKLKKPVASEVDNV